MPSMGLRAEYTGSGEREAFIKIGGGVADGAGGRCMIAAIPRANRSSLCGYKLTGQLRFGHT